MNQEIEGNENVKMNNDFPNETVEDLEDNSKENVLTEESVTMKHS